MRSIHTSISLFALLGATALGAQAQTANDHVPSSAQRHAELVAAVKAGETPRGELPFGDLGAIEARRSRAAVQRETRIAVAHGDIVDGEGTSYRSQAFNSVKSRAEVRAETREAMRLDLIPGGERLPQPTPTQLAQIERAGERAVAQVDTIASR